MMGLIKVFITDVKEVIRMTFGKIDTELGELPLLTEEELNKSQEQLDLELMENMLALQTELKVTVFNKWFFLVLGIMTASLGLYLLFANALLALLLLTVSVVLFKLYINRSGMAHAKHSMIGFLLLTDEELNRLLFKENGA
jgi:hypothetical protein